MFKKLIILSFTFLLISCGEEETPTKEETTTVANTQTATTTSDTMKETAKVISEKALLPEEPAPAPRPQVAVQQPKSTPSLTNQVDRTVSVRQKSSSGVPGLSSLFGIRRSNDHLSNVERGLKEQGLYQEDCQLIKRENDNRPLCDPVQRKGPIEKAYCVDFYGVPVNC